MMIYILTITNMGVAIMRGAFGQDHEFARKMANERWRRYRIRKSWLNKRKSLQSEN